MFTLWDMHQQPGQDPNYGGYGGYGQQPGQQQPGQQQPGNAYAHQAGRAYAEQAYGQQQAGPQYAPGVHPDPRAQLHAGVERYMAGVFGWMAIALAVSAASAWLAMLFLTPFIVGSGGLIYAFLFLPLVYVWVLGSRLMEMSRPAALAGFMGFAVVDGISLFWVPLVYPAASIVAVFGVTAVMFAALAMFGYLTKRDLSTWGRVLFMALIGLIVAFVVAMFIPGVAFWVLAIGVVVFAGLTAYDTQRIKQLYLTSGDAGNLSVYGALMLYLDFINLFLMLLQLFGMGGGDD